MSYHAMRHLTTTGMQVPLVGYGGIFIFIPGFVTGAIHDINRINYFITFSYKQLLDKGKGALC